MEEKARLLKELSARLGITGKWLALVCPVTENAVPQFEVFGRLKTLLQVWTVKSGARTFLLLCGDDPFAVSWLFMEEGIDEEGAEESHYLSLDGRSLLPYDLPNQSKWQVRTRKDGTRWVRLDLAARAKHYATADVLWLRLIGMGCSGSFVAGMDGADLVIRLDEDREFDSAPEWNGGAALPEDAFPLSPDRIWIPLAWVFIEQYLKSAAPEGPVYFLSCWHTLEDGGVRHVGEIHLEEKLLTVVF